jgi:hypothetical protein
MRKIPDTIKVRWRAFTIWQKLGYNPWHKPKEKKKHVRKGNAFYKGAFDSIPFLNDDAKRTFSHLLLRPGYMMRDYIRGDNERYLAPLTALIIFYAFFALVSAVLQPVQKETRAQRVVEQLSMDNVDLDEINSRVHGEDSTYTTPSRAFGILQNSLALMRTGYIYLHLDQFPEEVDTQHESSIAALEDTLRSQGIPLFIGKFILLWLALGVALRRYKVGMAACAAISAYTLCQFSFFMLFAVLLTWGKSASISTVLMGVLLTFDLHQLLGISYKKSIRRAIAVGIHYGLIFCGMLLLFSLISVGVAYYQN